MSFCISPKSILKFLLFSVSILLIAQLAIIVAQMVPGHGRFKELIRLFNFNYEQNIPTLYSSINLMFSAVLLFCIAMMHKSADSAWKSWLGLAFVMAFLSIDETVSVHEKFVAPTRDLLDAPDTVYFVWILPYALAVTVLFLGYFKFFMRLPKRTRFLFFLSGGIFIMGAAGFEIQGNLEQMHQLNTLSYRIINTLEELFEMLGVICFIYALTDYMTNQFGSFTISISAQQNRYPAPSKRLHHT